MVEAHKQFPPTRWTFVEYAGQPDHPAQEKALSELLIQYQPALKAYLAAQFRIDEQQADDLLQSFVFEKVIQAGMLARADRQRGKFRTFLLHALTNFVISDLRRQQALKRSPAEGSVSLDELSDQTPELVREASGTGFDLAFARGVIGEALKRMEAQCEASDRADIWGVFAGRLLQPIFEAAEAADYETLVRRFGFQSPGHAANVLITAKRMFARILRSVVGEYVATESDIEAELKELQTILSAASGAG
jgi:DNA-directed RNA polymerase specialized sigma24 family protein